MKFNKEFTAGIIIIGNEILSGRTVDKNTSFIATWLGDKGISVEEVRVIPDKEEVIIKTVNDLRKKFAYIFTTGGIGPTHDDITAESISKVFNQKYQYHPEAYKILEEFYKDQDFNSGRKKWRKCQKMLTLYQTQKLLPQVFMLRMYLFCQAFQVFCKLCYHC